MTPKKTAVKKRATIVSYSRRKRYGCSSTCTVFRRVPLAEAGECDGTGSFRQQIEKVLPMSLISPVRSILPASKITAMHSLGRIASKSRRCERLWQNVMLQNICMKEPRSLSLHGDTQKGEYSASTFGEGRPLVTRLGESWGNPSSSRSCQ